jgi:hypothetical protein
MYEYVEYGCGVTVRRPSLGNQAEYCNQMCLKYSENESAGVCALVSISLSQIRTKRDPLAACLKKIAEIYKILDFVVTFFLSFFT